MTDTITGSLKGARRAGARVETYLTRTLPFAAVVAATKTAKDAQADIRAALPGIFDRPTPYTLSSLATRPATKQQPRAHVFFKDDVGKGTPATRYLRIHASGGTRMQKRSEKRLAALGNLARTGHRKYYVPARGARVNKYGNIAGSKIVQILSQLKTSADPLQNETAASRRRAGSKRTSRFFIPRGEGSLTDAVWERRGGKAKPVLHFVRSAPGYRRRLPFHEMVQRTAQARYRRHLKDALRRFG